jgi:hypothetical protein
MRCARLAARKNEMGYACQILVGECEENRPSGTRAHRWKENIKTDLENKQGVRA